VKDIARWFITIAAIYATLGMTFGIVMGISQSFEYAHVHTHINLVGWVTLAMYGLVYRAYPEMAGCRLSAIHFWAANAGALIFLPGIFLAIEGQGVAPAIVGSLLTLAGMIVFLVNFLRRRSP
jgi:cbb3-type cytochrome oxidase subunit 1